MWEWLGRASTVTWVLTTLYHVGVAAYHGLNQLNGFAYAHHTIFPWVGGGTP